MTSIERFDRAYNAFYAFKSDIGTRTAAAGEIRTLLDGIKGVLYNKARKSEKEDVNWSQMSQRLAKNGTNSIECQNISAQERVRGNLINDLSIILKDREGIILRNLENIWIESLDHIFTILSLANI